MSEAPLKTEWWEGAEFPDAAEPLAGYTAGDGRDYAALLDADTLEVVECGAIRRRAGGLVARLPAAGQALAVNMPTPEGYQLALVEHADLRFDGSALDLTASVGCGWRRSLGALVEAPRAGWDPRELARATALASDEPAAPGWDHLLDLVRAHERLLTTGRRSPSAELAGVTLDGEIAPAGIDEIVGLAGSAVPAGLVGWVRVTMHPDAPFSAYDEMVDRCRAEGLRVMGQAVDSLQAGELTVEEYVERQLAAARHFGDRVAAWEIGSEANASWIEPIGFMPEKILGTASALRPLVSAQLILTVFAHYAAAQTPEDSPVRFLRSHPEVVAAVDGVLLSIHPDICPVGISVERVMRSVRAAVPGDAFVGVGELGYWHDEGEVEEFVEGERGYWVGPAIPRTARAVESAAGRVKAAGFYGGALLRIPGVAGGGFWWFFAQEALGEPGLVAALGRG